MKNTKKKLFVVALAVCLVAILSMGTLAWFSDSDEVNNDFSFATTDDTHETAFDIDLFEQDKDGNTTQTGIEYDNILPGDVLVKKAFVKNSSTTEGSISGSNYSQFVRATITISAADVILRNADTTDAEVIVRGMFDFNAAWSVDTCTYDSLSKTFVAVLYADSVLEPSNVINLFNNVTIPTWLTVADANDMNNTFDINIFAEAVQSDNTGYNNAKAAFGALVD